MTHEEVPAPAVRADAYDEHYYRTACAGYEAWTPSEGREIAPRYVFVFKALGLQPGDKLVDIGTGRGELLLSPPLPGSTRPESTTPRRHSRSRRRHWRLMASRTARAVLADARSLPVEDDYADVVTMLDVIEHLTPTELDRTLAQAKRILTPGGRLYIHTFPNRWVYDVTYRLQRVIAPGVCAPGR